MCMLQADLWIAITRPRGGDFELLIADWPFFCLNYLLSGLCQQSINIC